ncbi:MAG: HDOD domain-containing protein [Acidobacteria bacterium]|nr:HDOD domain-containing protein [Acidobacteriota bacterium]
MTQTETHSGRIEQRLQEILRRSDFPALSENVQRVMHSADEADASVCRMTSVILRDYALTLKLLRAANSPLYNRSGRPIHSITHAVALLGLEAVRNLAGSLVLFEHYRTGSPGLKELVLMSLLSANHAHYTASQLGYPRHEEAYLCGMYRNLGEVLAAGYFPRDYAAILKEMKERPMSLREAALGVLGFTLEDLGQACLRHWGIPDSISRCTQPWDPKPAAPASAEQLGNIAAFAHGLTAAVYRRDAASARISVRLLVDSYRSALGMDIEMAEQIASSALADAQDTLRALHVPLDDLRLRRQMEAALTEAPPPAAEAPPLPPAEPEPEDLLAKLVSELEQAVAGEGPGDLNGTLMMALEAICRGGGFDRAVFCLLNPEHTHVQARLGLGDDVETLLTGFRYPVTGPGNPIAVALMLRQDLVIDSLRDARFEQTDLVRTLKPACFGLLPVVVDGLAAGCLYFDRRAEAPAPGPASRKLLARVRDLAARAVARSRTAEGAAHKTH